MESIRVFLSWLRLGWVTTRGWAPNYGRKWLIEPWLMRIGLWDLFQMAMKMAYKGELLTTYQVRWSSKYSKGRFNSCIDVKTLTPRFTPSWRSVSNGKKRNSFSRMMSIRMTKKGSQITTPLSAPGFSSHLTHPSLNKSQQRPKKTFFFNAKPKCRQDQMMRVKTNRDLFVLCLSILNWKCWKRHTFQFQDVAYTRTSIVNSQAEKTWVWRLLDQTCVATATYVLRTC